MSVAPPGSSGRLTSERPDRKRPRTDFDDDDEVKVLENHPTLYFDDGNIILSCCGTLFCVHRSLLAKHSPVFQRMFAPRDGIKPDMLRGCRHYSVDDSREDMEVFLEMIYNGLRVDTVVLTAETFPLLSNLLQMCTKYEVERPRPEIIARIQAAWPRDLAQYDALNDTRVRKYLATHGHALPQGAVVTFVEEDTDVHPAAAIALLRQCGYASPELLAPLFYALSRGARNFSGAGFNVEPLSHADIERLIVGIERLRAEHLKMLVAMPEPAHGQFCGPALFSHRTVRIFPAASQGACAPIEFWGSAARMVEQAAQAPPASPCAMCCNASAAGIRATRAALWERMPEIFGLS